MNIICETERLFLVTLTKEAAPKVLAFYEDNKNHFEPWEPLRAHNFYSLAYQKATLTAEHNHMEEGRLFRYWVFDKTNPKKILGSLSFTNLLRDPYQSCCLGYKFDHRYLHQGYATESIKQGLGLMFDKQFHRIDAYIMPSNTPSLQLVQRLNFHCEGLSRSFAKVNGIWTDHMHYVLINPNEDLHHD